MSSYLFVLAMEKLGPAMNLAVSNGKWKPIKLRRNGPNLSHLFFAGDLILFEEVNSENAKVI